MKKTLLFLLSFILFVPAALAATLYSDYSTKLRQYETREIAPVKVTSTSDGDITAQHGIRIMLGSEDHILWDDREIAVTGNALTNGKVNLNVKAEYAPDYKSVFIPVMEDFEAGDWLNIEGLTLRAYDARIVDRELMMDLNGDMQSDVTDLNTYEVTNDERSDNTPPYPVRDLSYEINADGSVSFSWNMPPDYDYDSTVINRVRVKNGFSQTAQVYDDYTTAFTDSDVEGVTTATYSLRSVDWNGNQGDAVTVVIDFTAPAEEPEEEPVEPIEEPEEEVSAPEDEVAELSRLLNYYNVRYSIKCMPSGVAVPDNDSACLWARIDLIYAQEITGQEKVAGLALSERDLELMATRRQWPELRYEDNCVAVQEPASYCPALGKALDRISYFLD